MPDLTTTYTAFIHDRRLASGPLAEVAVLVRHTPADRPVLIFNDATGKAIDIDTRGTDDEIRDRYTPEPEPPRGRGRPKLGVVPREVTLLPRHWDWLNAQPGGASNAIRKLVDVARSSGEAATKARMRKAHEAAYHFMHAIAGDFAGYEEATRALFANDRTRFEALIEHWPQDVREYALRLAVSE